MRQTVITVLFSILFIGTGLQLIPAKIVSACSCVKPPSVERIMLEPNIVIFSGKVIEIDENKKLFNQSSADPISVHFQVNKTWKNVEQSNVIVNTATNSASCGYEFELHENYLVYAHENDGSFETTICSRTTKVSEAVNDLKALSESEKPTVKVENTTENQSQSYVIVGVMALVLVIILAFIIFRRRKLTKD